MDMDGVKHVLGAWVEANDGRSHWCPAGDQPLNHAHSDGLPAPGPTGPGAVLLSRVRRSRSAGVARGGRRWVVVTSG